MKWIPKMIGALVVAGLFLGWKLYNKASTAGEAKQQLMTLCESESVCMADVERHFEACFESNYRIGSRRRNATLDGHGLTSCINSKSGVEHFNYES